MNRDDNLQRAALNLCLSCWVDYMGLDDRDSGVSRMKLHAPAEDKHEGYESDPYAEQRAADLKTGEAVNAMIDSLTQVHRWAIYKSQGMTTQWRFSSVDYATVLAEARDELDKKLRKNIATRIFFS